MIFYMIFLMMPSSLLGILIIKNLHLKANVDIFFWTLIIMLIFENLILIFYIWVLNTPKKGTMNTFQFRKQLDNAFKHLKKIFMVV